MSTAPYPQLRVKEIRAQVDGKPRSASGTLIDDTHVLTAAHAVLGRDSSRPRKVQVVSLDGKDIREAEVVWFGQPDDLDVALLRFVGDGLPSEGSRGVEFGSLASGASRVPCEAIGYPRMVSHLSGAREAEHLNGHINATSGLRTGMLSISVDSSTASRDDREPSVWAGMSGAGVFTAGLLVGVIVTDALTFDGRRLGIVPMTRVLANASFIAALGSTTAAPHCQPVDIFPLLASSRRALASPASLLRAETAAVKFRGREDVLRSLEYWCEGNNGLSLRVITGPGGQGKTRLAHELSRRMLRRGWAAGFLAADANQAAIRSIEVAGPPVLLMIDYAESRADQTMDLVKASISTGRTIRLLLLARALGDWWKEALLPELTGFVEIESQVALGPLATTVEERRIAYRYAIDDLASAMSITPLAATSDDTAGPETPETPLQTPPQLANDSFSNPLSLQMLALVELLQRHTPTPEPFLNLSGVDQILDVLLAHEQRYWHQTARSRGLTTPLLRQSTIGRAVCATSLSGAGSESEGVASLARLQGVSDLTPEQRRLTVDWLRELYPPPRGSYWGSLEPDRVLEHLVAKVAAEGRDWLVDFLSEGSETQLHRAFTVLSRASAEADSVRQLMTKLSAVPSPNVVRAALRVALETPHPNLLVQCLMNCAESTRDAAEIITKALPVQSVRLSPVGVAAAKKLLSEARSSVAVGVQGPHLLAPRLRYMAYWVGQMNAHEEALDLLTEAVTLLKQLPNAVPQWRYELAMSLNDRAGRLTELRRPSDALEAMSEAVGIYEDLAIHDRTRYGANYVMGMQNLANKLEEAGRPSEALTWMSTALRSFEEYQSQGITGFDPDDGAILMINYSNKLAGVGRVQEAVTASESSVAEYRKLCLMNADAYRPGLAFALYGYLRHLVTSRRLDDALKAIDQCIKEYQALTQSGYRGSEAPIRSLNDLRRRLLEG